MTTQPCPSIPLLRSSNRAREYLQVLARAEALLEAPDDLTGPQRLEQTLDLLDILGSFLRTALLPGDTFYLESEILHLAFSPAPSLEARDLIAVTRSHLHLLRYEASGEAPDALTGRKTPLSGVPLGLFIQPVGYLGSREVVVISKDGRTLHELRLDLSAAESLVVMHHQLPESIPLTALGKSVSDLESPLQIEVRLVEEPPASPRYDLSVRRHSSDRWWRVHSANHPLRTPLDDGRTLYFTARSSQIMAVQDPLRTPTPLPRTVIALDTPSPVQALVRYDTPEGFSLLAATADGTLFVLDPASDRLRGKFDTDHSITAAAFQSGPSPTLVLGTPDGLLQFYQPVDTLRIEQVIASLLERLQLSTTQLLAFTTLPETGEGTRSGEYAIRANPQARNERPWLRLLTIHRLLQGRCIEPDTLGQVRAAILQSWYSALRGGKVLPAEVVRFLSYQFKLLSQPEPQPSDPRRMPLEPCLATLFSVMDEVGPNAYGDARRRLERLLRRLRDEWLGPEAYEQLRSLHAPHLSLHSLSIRNLRLEARQSLEKADKASLDKQPPLLLGALAATWRQSLSPLNRALSLQGIAQAVPVVPAHADPDHAWLVGLSREELQIFRIGPGPDTLRPYPPFPLSGGLRLASGPLLEARADVVAVARHDRLTLLRFQLHDGQPSLASLPIAELPLQEPVTAMELLELPSSGLEQHHVPALALGQADGRVSLRLLAPAPGSAESQLGPRFILQTILELHRPAPVHHVALFSWPEKPALFIGADPLLHIYHHARVEDGHFLGDLEVLELEAAVTALTVAWPPPRSGDAPRPMLVVGLANGLVQAFQPPSSPGFTPELSWVYRASQVITNLAWLPTPDGGWFVAAADDGELHLLRYGELHHQVAVERFPFDLTPLQLAGEGRTHLMVSSPARAVTLLGLQESNPQGEVAPLLSRIQDLVPRGVLLESLAASSDTARQSLGLHILSTAPLPELLEYATRLEPSLRSEPVLARTYLTLLFARAAAEPEARRVAMAFALHALEDERVPVTVKVQLLHTLGEVQDRVEDQELDRIVSSLDFEEPLLARAFLKLLEHLWARFRHAVDDLVWWRGLHRLETSLEPLGRPQLRAFAGTFASKLLRLTRENVLDQIRLLRDLEERGLNLARMVCEALSLPYMTSDLTVRRCLEQYARLMNAHTPDEVYTEVLARRDLLQELELFLPQARTARLVYDDLLDAFDYTDYEQYSRFLVDAAEFLPQVRALEADHLSLMAAFAEARSRLVSVAPPASSRPGFTQLQDRLHVLSSQAEMLQDFARHWSGELALEHQLVGAILFRWREKILLPEIHRLQDTVQLALGDVKVSLPDDGGLAEVRVRIHNLGGRALPGLTVGLRPSPKDPWLWESSPEWCQGPIRYGESIEYHTEILLDESTELVALAVEVTLPDNGGQTTRHFATEVRVEHEEPPPASAHSLRTRDDLAVTFEALRMALVRADGGRMAIILSEESHERDQLVMDLATALTEGVETSRRAALILDLHTLLEGPGRTTRDELPPWWLAERVARALHEKRLLSSMPDRNELRSDPRAALDACLHRALEGGTDLWIVLRRATRAFSGNTPQRLEQARAWLRRLLEHPSHHVRLLLGGDFGLAARLCLHPSPLAGRVDVLDVDRPYPPEAPRAKAEHLARLNRVLQDAKVTPSELVRHKLFAHVGHSLAMLRRLLPRLEAISTEGWLQWQRKGQDSQGEPEELEPFLSNSLSSISRPLKERLRALPFFHRLALAAVASGRAVINRKDLREGMVLARDIATSVRTRANRPKRLYASDALLLDGDVSYLQVTVGDLQGRLEVGQFRSLDFSFPIAHLLSVAGMPQLLADLEALGLVRHTSGPTGPVHTLAIPLFRRWLAQAHPFEVGEEANLARRLVEDFSVPEAIPLLAYVELASRLSSQGQLPDFLVFLGMLEPDQRRGGTALDAAYRRWDRLLSLARRAGLWVGRPTAENYRALVQEWAGLFGGKVELLNLAAEDGLFVASLELSSLHIPRLGRALVFALSRELNTLRAERMREAVRQASVTSEDGHADAPAGSMGLTLQPIQLPRNAEAQVTRLPGVPDNAKELLGDHFIPLTEKELVATALADDGHKTFLDLLARGGFRFQFLSPYQPLGPLRGRAMDVLFVGREAEIDEVLAHPERQFAIVGSRRIGKTSLLLKLADELSRHLGEKAKVLYLDCTTHAPAQVWKLIASGLGYAPFSSEEPSLDFRARLDGARHPVVLLLDEIDGIYEAAGSKHEKEAEDFIWTLRSLSASGKLRVIFAGYVRIYEKRHDIRSPFHNFTTFHRLSALSPEAARHLVRSPLASLDIEMASEGLIDQILDRTYRVPWIIQRFCHQLITCLDERLVGSRRALRRTILKEDVDGVSVQIEEELFAHFTSPKVMSTLDQVMLLTMVEANIQSFREDELMDHLERRLGTVACERVRHEDIQRALDNLTLTLALTVQAGVYSFPLEMYVNVMRGRLGDVKPRLDRLIQKLKRDLDLPPEG